MSSNLKKGLLRGPKVCDNHKTIIPASEKVITALKKMPEVKKISPSLMASCGPGKHRVKCNEITGGLKIMVRGGGSLQIIYVYSDDIQKTKQSICELFG